MAAVLAGHIALLLGLRLMPAAQERQESTPAVATRFIWLRLLPAAPTPPTKPATGQSANALPIPRVRLGSSPGQSAAQLPAPEVTWVPAQPEPAPSTPASPAPRPLLLTLPPTARGTAQPWRNPALDDPSSNTRVSTLEARLAKIMGPDDGPMIETALPDGSRQFRRGKDCVVVRPSRAGALDPFNNSVSPKPQLVDSC